jgi:Mor transcription activator family
MQEPLPPRLQDVADVISREAALYLTCWWPRTKTGNPKEKDRICIAVPKLENLKPDHRLAQILDFPTAIKLSESFGGENLFLPKCRYLHVNTRNKVMREMADEGMTTNELVTWFCMTPQQIRSIVRKSKTRMEVAIH